MNKLVTRPLKAFLCHASGDKPPVRELYKRLVFEGVDAWLDKEKLLPGQDWRVEIPRAVKEADVVIVFLSKNSISKEGYVQKEIKFALDIAEEKPEGTIFLIPARLEECVVPERLSRWHWVDLYEENGFVQLLRSMKLRADAVGASVVPALYEESDKEIGHRIEQLYTEGLAAFYTEEWDKACQRFQTILSEHPSHKNAAEKLAQAEKQRSLARSYAQAMEGYKAENWQAAIRSLEELLQKSAEYKDAAQLLRNARKQKQLKELYVEAKTLHSAQKWQAVLKVFEQITTIESNFPDSDGLLPSAQKEVAELKRLADLNDLYSHAVREMDAGNWNEARRLLEQVHKAQTGFLETERLLKKVENEIAKVEEHNKRNDQVNVLYEQAHGLLRTKKWRKVVEKLEEIKKLDERFIDTDEIFTKARTELEREDRETQRQNELAAMYAEAVRLLQEEKYQEALDKWQEVKTVDPKYPDRQWVQRTVRRKLGEIAKPAQIKSRWRISRPVFAGVIGLFIVGFIILSVVLSDRENQTATPTLTFSPTRNAIVSPTSSNTPSKPSCFSTQNCQQLANQAVTANNPELALEYFNLAIDMTLSSEKPKYSNLWRDRAEVLDQLGRSTDAQSDRNTWWLCDLNTQKIVFDSDRDGNFEIYVMDVKGTKVVRLTFDSSKDWGAVWSPDGSTIAFTSDRSGNDEIYLMDADGSNVRNLTNNSAVHDNLPSWSPDGSKIVFHSRHEDGSQNVFVMNADGSNPVCITCDDNANDWGATWSPIGDRIVYSTVAFDSEDNEIVEVNVDGTNLRNLTKNVANDFFPAWSPDGQKITFTSTRKYNDVRIFTMELEHQYVEQIADIHGWGSKWSPDGNQIAFTSYNDEHDNEIVLYDLRTKEITFITNNDANDEYPSWSLLP